MEKIIVVRIPDDLLKLTDEGETVIEEIEAVIPYIDGDTQIILDFERVGFIDSTGLWSLIRYGEMFMRSGSPVKIINMRKYLLRIFQLSGLATIFKLFVHPNPSELYKKYDE